MRHSTLQPPAQRCWLTTIGRQLIVLPFMFILAACGDSDPQTSSVDTDNRVSVRVSQVEPAGSAEPLYFAGVTRVQQRATLAFQLSGTLAQRRAQIGDQVRRGDLLATLHNPQLTPARDAAQARLAQLDGDRLQAQRDLQRIDSLHSRGVLAIQELEQQQARLASLDAATDNARATLQEAKDLLSETQLLAPFDGTIEDVLLEPGEYLQPGQPVIRISANEGLEVEVQVPGNLVSALQPGDSVNVRRSLTGTKVTGQVRELGQNNTRTALYPVVISLAGTNLQTGEAVEVGISQPVEQGLRVPITAVMRSAQGLSVFAIRAGRAERLPVVVRQVMGEYALLGNHGESGSLTDEDFVVYAGLTRLTEGDYVEVLP